ncbi:MAG: hypothetical protein AAF732_12255, partial [Pseudomonadota bacterium]
MMRLVLLICLCAVTAMEARSSQPEPTFRNRTDLLAWISAYREEPRPDHVAGAVQAMSKLGIFRDLDRAAVFIGFVAGVVGENQLDAERLIAEMFPLRPEDQVVIIRAIADSGLPNWRDLMARFVERMPARKILIRNYLYGKSKPLQELPLDKGPEVLDAWWGVYFATGRYEPIRRLLPALKWSDEGDNLDRLTIASMAMWTLSANASRDKPLLDFLRAEAYRQPAKVAAPLRELVLAAETFETAKIRKAQVAKMEELKKRGPASGRQWAWWSRAASTAIALGCVVAGAAGQAQLGLPCLIGGTVSSAAERILRAP